MTLPALYVVAAEYRDAVEQLSDLDLPAEVVADTLEGLAGDLETKATNVAMFIRNLDGMAAQIKEAEAAMAARRKSIEARSDRIREYLKSNMEACKISKIESPWFKLAIRQNPPSLIVDNAAEIPHEFFNQPPPPEPVLDKKALKEVIAAGSFIPGAHIERATRLEIK